MQWAPLLSPAPWQQCQARGASEEMQQGMCAICEAGCHGLSGSHVRCDVAIRYCTTACCFLLAAACLKLDLNDNRLLVNEPVCECHQHDVLDYIRK